MGVYTTCPSLFLEMSGRKQHVSSPVSEAFGSSRGAVTAADFSAFPMGVDTNAQEEWNCHGRFADDRRRFLNSLISPFVLLS
jgi:hypothetical protein